jgi:hypothetical protein
MTGYLNWSSALTMSNDILPKSLWSEFSEKRRLQLIQLLIVAFGIISVWGFEHILRSFAINLFDFLYIIVISQLSLIGPVVFGLYGKEKKNMFMWIAIALALVVGFGSSVIGGMTGNKILIDGAGTFSVVASLMSTWMLNYFFKTTK